MAYLHSYGHYHGIVIASDIPRACVRQTFSLAFMTLFHITAGEPWPEEPSLFEEDGSLNWTVCSFHIVYELSVDWVILQARH
jgi:hypothetical protein